jgi:hypothetical protein
LAVEINEELVIGSQFRPIYGARPQGRTGAGRSHLLNRPGLAQKYRHLVAARAASSASSPRIVRPSGERT